MHIHPSPIHTVVTILSNSIFDDDDDDDDDEDGGGDDERGRGRRLECHDLAATGPCSPLNHRTANAREGGVGLSLKPSNGHAVAVESDQKRWPVVE